jgi:hypothetical protein
MFSFNQGLLPPSAPLAARNEAVKQTKRECASNGWTSLECPAIAEYLTLVVLLESMLGLTFFSECVISLIRIRRLSTSLVSSTAKIICSFLGSNYGQFINRW